jgi:hypothetical protein
MCVFAALSRALSRLISRRQIPGFGKSSAIVVAASETDSKVGASAVLQCGLPDKANLHCVVANRKVMASGLVNHD